MNNLRLPRFFASSFIFILFLFVFYKNSYAAYYAGDIFLSPGSSNLTIQDYIDAGSCNVCPSLGGTKGDYCVNSQNPNNCGYVTCPGGNAWTKYNYNCYNDPNIPAACRRVFNRDSQVYSIGDKCTSGGPYLNPGYCDTPWGGPIYKTCCSRGTPSYVSPSACFPFNSDNAGDPEGYCPGGYMREVFCGGAGQPPCGQEACGPLPPTCTPGTTYTQCGGTGGCTNNYDNNHTVNVTPTNCSDGTTTYSCSDAGVFPGQCGNPYTCDVSWSFSNTNPPTNSTVNVSVTGNSSNAGWSNVAYSVDGGTWNTSVNVPTPGTPNYTFNVNSDSAGPHSLRFAVNSGSLVCTSSGLNSFTTQALPQNNNASCGTYTVNGGNTVYSGTTVLVSLTMQNSGDTTWTPSGSFPYRLGAQQAQDDPNWGTLTGADSGLGIRPMRWNLLSSNVGPGGATTFNFNATAPPTAGTYRLSFKMVKEGIEWFGQMCQRDVPVSTPPPTPFIPSCTGTVTNAATRTIRWDATVSPTGTYTYSWLGDASGTTASVTQTYATTGVKNATVSVRNSSGTLQTANCSTTIPAPFSYNLTNTGNRSVTRGASVTNTITANLASGATQSVTFSASGFPSGVTGSLGPTSCNPTCSTILTMNAGTTASTGTFPITVTGTSSSMANQTTSFNLTVTAPATNPPTAFTQNAPSPGCSGTSPYVDLFWTTSTNATSYEVYRNGSFITGGLNQLNYRDSTVAPSTSYTYVIRASNSRGSIDSGSRTVTTLSCTSGSTPPPTPAPSSGCAWIQTTGGDVHSNTGINTPCGP